MKSGWQRARTKRRRWKLARSRSSAELQVHAEAAQNLEEESVSARERLEAKTAERDETQAALRERERGVEATRMHVLKLLGEASTLRNQLAQIDEYLASMERDTARSRKEEEGATADLARLEQVKADLSTQPFARGRWSWNLWPISADAWKRTCRNAARAFSPRDTSWKRFARVYRGRRRGRIRWKKFFRTARIPPNR